MAQTLLPVGSRFRQYSIVRLVGSGGMGAVFEATHVDLKKRVALKVLHPSFAANSEVKARFLREGEATSRISHPYVVDVTDFGIHDGVPFLVMEFLDGESLADRLNRGSIGSVREITDIMVPVCAGVYCAHLEGVIHRDLKPENVFLARRRHGEMQPKVVDFGVSKVLDGENQGKLTMTNSMVGSPMYMSPEQIRASKSVDARSDQYSLGVMLYELATDRRPFEGDNLYEVMGGIVRGECTRPREHRPDLPVEFEAIILRAMHVEPSQRFGSVRQLGREMLPYASERIRALCGDMLTESSMIPSQRPTVPESLSPARGETVSGTRPSAPMDVPPRADSPSGSTSSSGSRDGALAATRDGVPTLEGSTRSVPQAVAAADSANPTARPAKRSTAAWLSIGAIAIAVGAVGTWAAARHTPDGTAVPRTTATTVPAYHATLHAEPASAALELDGRPAGTGTLERSFARDGTEHTLRVSAPGYAAQTLRFRDAPPPASVALTADPTPSVPAVPTPGVPAEPVAPAVATSPSTEPNGSTSPTRTARTTVTHHNRANARTSTTAPTGTRPAAGTSTATGTNGAAILE